MTTTQIWILAILIMLPIIFGLITKPQTTLKILGAIFKILGVILTIALKMAFGILKIGLVIAAVMLAGAAKSTTDSLTPKYYRR